MARTTENPSKATAQHTAFMIAHEHPIKDEYDALDALEYLTALRGEIEDQIAGLVAVARAHGAEWQHVANALSVTKQAAHKRYRS